jgi:hypothetical protein
LALKARSLLNFNKVLNLVLIFRGGLKWLFKFFIKKLYKKFVFKRLMIGYKLSWPHGGCKGLGKRNIKRPKRKKFYFPKIKKIKKFQKTYKKTKKIKKRFNFYNKQTLKFLKYKKK